MRKGIILNLPDFFFFVNLSLQQVSILSEVLEPSWLQLIACLQYTCLNEYLDHVCFLKTKICYAKIGEIILRHGSTNCLVTYGGLSLELMQIFASTFINAISCTVS